MHVQNKKACQEQLAALRKEFDEFSYIVSHDLKAPVRAIGNLSAWIEEDLGESVPEEVLQNMNLLRNRANRLELMIDALLKYSRVSTYQLDLEETDVKRLIEAARDVSKASQAILVQTPDSLPVFVTYKEKLGYVFSQLIQNAAFFGVDEKLAIAVSVKDEKDFYTFEVADNGGGVPDEAIDKIFKLFYTVAPKDTVNTVGAGLTIARRITQSVGGEMRARNNTLGGLSICFTWPKEIKFDTNILIL